MPINIALALRRLFSWRDQIIRDFRATVPELYLLLFFPTTSTTVLGTWSWLFSKPIWLRA
jgi:hypothetical protein